jgi:prevent-host-death family protein
MIITANEVKTKGVSFIEKVVKKFGEAIISVRGKRKYIVLPVEEYERLKEIELDRIIELAEEDYREGRVIKETAEKHFKRIGI